MKKNLLVFIANIHSEFIQIEYEALEQQSIRSIMFKSCNYLEIGAIRMGYFHVKIVHLFLLFFSWVNDPIEKAVKKNLFG